MGITIAYRGRLADLARIEDLEDRVLDFALEVGGMAQIWRSRADEHPERMVRGVILHVAPGQESTSLLFSPEGWLIGLTDIKVAERAALAEPPWCFTKTQFGHLEGHVALIEMLRSLKSEFMPELEVSDEGGYWETRDLAELARRHAFLAQAIEGLAEGIQRHGLSREAAEDPEILIRRIERIAAQVHRVLGRPAEHPPVTFPDDTEAFGDAPDSAATEALWDQLFKQNRRQQEQFERALEERRSAGQDDETAFEGALEDLGLEVPGEEGTDGDEPWSDNDEQPFAESNEAASEEDAFLASRDQVRHPLLERAMELMQRLHGLFRDADSRFDAALRTLFQGAGDLMGGLAQAMSGRVHDADDPGDYGLAVTQLKRALRGAAFARGALFLLRPAIAAESFDELQGTFEQFGQDIFQELGRRRAKLDAEEP